MKKCFLPFATSLLALVFTACEDESPVSMVDPLPFPSYLETNKDLSVDPGDSFFDYCNGAWLKSQPVPAEGAVGGLYDAEAPMGQRIEELKASVPDIGRFYKLVDNLHGQPEKVRTYIDALKARFPKPSTREEAFRTLGRMIADGIAPWVRQLPSWNLQHKEGKLMGFLAPPFVSINFMTVNPDHLVPLSLTRASETSVESLIIQGMGLDDSQFLTDPDFKSKWNEFENSSLEDLCQLIDDVWESYNMFVSQEHIEKLNLPKQYVVQQARLSLSYTLSYHLAERYISPADKERFVRITREIQASFRKRIQNVGWMSETTRSNALDKLDNMALYVAYPDHWYTDCISSFTDCETLVEAVDRNNQGISRLKTHLLGSNDGFNFMLVQKMKNGNQFFPTDLTIANAFYLPQLNGVYIFPAILLPPIMPSDVSEACTYAVYSIIGHEITHGFDTEGGQYDKWGNLRNWWTVADQMAFEERRQNLIQCYNHLELDPERFPGVYGDGKRTLTENIADLGGFLTALAAYHTHLIQEGYSGESYDNQLRKFFEYFAYIWCTKYSDAKLENIKTADVHSHSRLRVNGVVMNTDIWYQLYNVDQNNYLYLPQERRTYIW